MSDAGPEEVATAPDARWRRLDPRTIGAFSALVAGPLIPTVLIMALSRASAIALLVTVLIGLAVALVVAAIAAVDWYFTWYRITDERLELSKGRLSRSHRSVPRDRIRSVDLTSDPAHRVFGLSVVKIGTGRQSGWNSEVKLDAVTRRQAELLRQQLLPRGSKADTAATAAGETSGDAPEIARLSPAWFGYCTLTVSLALIVWGAIGSAIGSFSELLTKLGVFTAIFERLNSAPLWTSAAVLACVALVVGVLGSLLLSIEMWWGFRLTRESNGTLRVRRGLLTTRSVSLEERRLRGVEIAEPLLLRWAGGARTNAVATGLNEAQDGRQPDRKALLPPAPRPEAQRVAAAVLRQQQPPTGGERLRPHPRAALRRRLTWALTAAAPVVAAAAAAAVVGWVSPWAASGAAAAAVALAAAFGVDAYRNLGHELTGEYLVTRHGSGMRRTVALQRGGIIGWRIRQSLFQRRSGLVTVGATTAAGHSLYEIHDVTTAHGLAFADEAVPELLEPFLERP